MPRMIKKGSTNVTDYVLILDSSDGSPETGVTIADLDLQYVRNGADPSAKVDAIALAATDTAHTDNYMIEVDGTDQPGLYRVDWPDAAFATGKDQVVCTVKGTGFLPAHKEYQLVDFDPADAVRLGLTALPDAAADAAGGLPISDAGGLDMDDLPLTAEFEARTVSNTAALAIEDQYDGTGLIGDEYPARQDQVVTGSSGGGGARNWAPVEDNTGGAIWDSVVFVGSVVSGTYESAGVGIIDSHSINDVGNDIDIVYGFAFTDDQIVTGIHVYADMDGKDRLDLEMYNFVTSSWVPVLTIEQRNAVLVKLTNDFQGTGANLGKAYARFDNNEPTTPENLELWTLLLETTSSPTGIPNGATIAFDAAENNKNFVGENWNLALGVQDISGSYFSGANVTGISSATTGVTFANCFIGAATLPPGKYINCGFGKDSGVFTAASAGQYVFMHCYSLVPGSGSPEFIFTGLAATTGINARGWTGGVKFNLDSDCTLSHEVLAGGKTQVVSNAATVEIRGVTRELDFDLTGAGTLQFIGITGLINVSGTTTATLNLHGISTSITDTSSAATVNDYTQNSTDQKAILVDTNELQTDDVPGLIAALNNISASDVWAEASARTDDFGTLLEQIADWHFNEETVVNATGGVTLRNKGDSADLATWTIDDDDTNTKRGEASWV